MLGIPTSWNSYVPLISRLFSISRFHLFQLTQKTDFRNHHHRILRASFWIKLTFILLEVILALSFISCNFAGAKNAAAVLEWAVSFIFTFYIFSFFVDLIPAVKTKRREKRFGGSSDETEMQVEMERGEGVGERGKR